jgi:hypothetical protein
MRYRSSKQSTLPDQLSDTPRDMLRRRNKNLRQCLCQSMTDAQWEEKLRLIKALKQNTLTQWERRYLVNQLFGLCFPKKWSAHLRLVGRVEKAQEREDIIRWSKAKNGGLLNDVKREKFKDLGFGSIEAMDQSLKRTRQQLKHYKPNSFDQFEAMEKRIREGYKKQ